jgi:hypothetical protein
VSAATERKCLGCTLPIPRERLTCSGCWWRLPLEVRNMAPGLARARTAAEWFKDNPRGT